MDQNLPWKINPGVQSTAKGVQKSARLTIELFDRETFQDISRGVCAVTGLTRRP